MKFVALAGIILALTPPASIAQSFTPDQPYQADTSIQPAAPSSEVLSQEPAHSGTQSFESGQVGVYGNGAIGAYGNGAIGAYGDPGHGANGSVCVGPYC